MIKQGSINLAYESQADGHSRRHVTSACAARTSSAASCRRSVKIDLNDTDSKRAKQIAKYPWFEKKKAWQKEIELMLKNGFKLEVEALDQQGHQLRHRNLRPRAAGRSGFPGLSVSWRRSCECQCTESDAVWSTNGADAA